ncbi:uncharacterized protein PODANS_4_3516 [Podospora anserina S mat+]|uniref:Podospora anserina S mat+ genomic DNA chromosome 4, supercontig 4 n=1 Tax=Podospora anserina (strain S / ATCC MYA-4624 / DSM 980 / FGSC 10383) TaxID=515849 RepID=B2AQQ0_PODAN|nr:uncharacterized protein PODANS_4_3516 [Podospora anserina S mat+]CAP66477.1 unnamed protein product [Podospora anserina S mat+]CDP28206.1 Putative protein of unknown function [Podospora anserina S mat+]
MSTIPRRSNSTNPRPGSSAFPRVPRSKLAPQPLDLKRSNTTAGTQSSQPQQEQTSRSTPYSSSARERIDPRAPLSPIPSSAGSRSTPYSSNLKERTDLRSSAAPRPLQTAQSLNRRPSNATETTTGHRRRPSLGGESIGQFASSRRPSAPDGHNRRSSASQQQQSSNTPPRRPSAPTHTRRPSGPTYQPQPQRHNLRPSAQQQNHGRRDGGGGGVGGRPPITQQVDQATKTQINQTYAVTMMASPYNPLPFFLPIPLGIAMLLTPSGKDVRGAGPAPMRAGTVGGRR